ncbi:hydroxymethylglutaryl-CoA lyase [Cryptococcus neoformans A2-102-5]|nr:hydroxymethylglutaryl-CoA lyase [Cryptococcus neoformans var. grubii D17-1]OXG97865.1 hydroxymethylglutaryl-CoA lyase [Cryptococcus neoformans var. grubii A2-102-5]
MPYYAQRPALRNGLRSAASLLPLNTTAKAPFNSLRVSFYPSALMPYSSQKNHPSFVSRPFIFSHRLSPDCSTHIGDGGDSVGMSRLPSPLFAPIPLRNLRNKGFKNLLPRKRLFSSTATTASLLPPSPVASDAEMMSDSEESEAVRQGKRISKELMTTSSAVRGRYLRIVDVSPRDGLQNLKGKPVPTEVKKELVERLLEAGVRNIEVGSFVRGDWVPQMADTPHLLPLLPPFTGKTLSPPSPVSRSESPFSGRPSSPSIGPLTSEHLPPHAEDVHYPVLVPNMRGLDNLIKLQEDWCTKGLPALTDEIAVFVSATEAFSQANNHAPISKVLGSLPSVINKAKSHGFRVRGYVSCVITCPYSGPTDPNQAVDVAEKLLQMGCYEVSMGDTTGEGDPDSWKILWDRMKEKGLDMDKIAAHVRTLIFFISAKAELTTTQCHDTFSLALSSILSLVPYGLKTIDSSLAGLGGCPYSPGATGNVPTEDVVYALHKMGYETGIDLDRLVESGNWLANKLGVRNESRVGRAIWARRQRREEIEGKGAETEDGM